MHSIKTMFDDAVHESQQPAPAIDVRYLDDDLVQIAAWASDPTNVIESVTPEFLQAIPRADLDRLGQASRRLAAMVGQEAWRRLTVGDAE